MELVALGVSAYGRLAKLKLSRLAAGAAAAPAHGASEANPRARSRRPVYFGTRHGLCDTPIYDFDTLVPGHRLSGPAVIEQRFSTVLVLPGHQARMDDYGNILMEVPQ